MSGSSCFGCNVNPECGGTYYLTVGGGFNCVHDCPFGSQKLMTPAGPVCRDCFDLHKEPGTGVCGNCSTGFRLEEDHCVAIKLDCGPRQFVATPSAGTADAVCEHCDDNCLECNATDCMVLCPTEEDANCTEGQMYDCGCVPNGCGPLADEELLHASADVDLCVLNGWYYEGVPNSASCATFCEDGFVPATLSDHAATCASGEWKLPNCTAVACHPLMDGPAGACQCRDQDHFKCDFHGSWDVICVPGFYLDAGACHACANADATAGSVSACPGFYNNSGTLAPCDKDCSECSDESTCTSCADPANMVNDVGVCGPPLCDIEDCAMCSKSHQGQEVCMGCKEGYHFTCDGNCTACDEPNCETGFFRTQCNGAEQADSMCAPCSGFLMLEPVTYMTPCISCDAEKCDCPEGAASFGGACVWCPKFMIPAPLGSETPCTLAPCPEGSDPNAKEWACGGCSGDDYHHTDNGEWDEVHHAWTPCEEIACPEGTVGPNGKPAEGFVEGCICPAGMVNLAGPIMPETEFNCTWAPCPDGANRDSDDKCICDAEGKNGEPADWSFLNQDFAPCFDDIVSHGETSGADNVIIVTFTYYTATFEIEVLHMEIAVLLEINETEVELEDITPTRRAGGSATVRITFPGENGADLAKRLFDILSKNPGALAGFTATKIVGPGAAMAGTTGAASTTAAEDKGLSDGAKIGLGVGLGVGGALCIGIIAAGFLMMRNRGDAAAGKAKSGARGGRAGARGEAESEDAGVDQEEESGEPASGQEGSGDAASGQDEVEEDS